MLSIQADTSHIIQLSVAPAFMLAAIGGTLTVLTNRLARINDRTLKRREEATPVDGSLSHDTAQELSTLERRAKVINAAITAGSCCAMLVCVMIGMLFLGNELQMGFDRSIAVLFMLAMAGLIATYLLLLAEIFIAQRSIHPI